MAESPETQEEAKPDDANVAAEWEAAMAAEDGAGAEGDDAAAAAASDAADPFAVPDTQAARVLNQDEIDSLLGFGAQTSDSSKSDGIQAIVNSALVSYERLPMLEVVFDRLVRMMTTSLRNFTSDNVEVSIDNMTSIRFGDYLNSIPLPAMLGVFKAEEWDNYGLIVVDSSLIYSIVDVLLGGRRGTAPMRIEGRPYTTIERNLVERMIGVVLGDMNAAFEPLEQGHLPLRPPRDQPALRHHRAAGQRRGAGQAAHRHGRPRRPDRIHAALRHARAGARAAAADVHGREVRPRLDLGGPSGERAVADRRRPRAPCSTSRP